MFRRGFSLTTLDISPSLKISLKSNLLHLPDLISVSVPTPPTPQATISAPSTPQQQQQPATPQKPPPVSCIRLYHHHFSGGLWKSAKTPTRMKIDFNNFARQPWLWVVAGSCFTSHVSLRVDVVCLIKSLWYVVRHKSNKFKLAANNNNSPDLRL